MNIQSYIQVLLYDPDIENLQRLVEYYDKISVDHNEFVRISLMQDYGISEELYNILINKKSMNLTTYMVALQKSILDTINDSDEDIRKNYSLASKCLID